MYKFITLLILILLTTSVVAQRRTALSGYVYYISGAQKIPLTGANVTVKDLSTVDVTDGNGYFKVEFNNKQPGETVTLAIEKPGYIPQDENIMKLRIPNDPNDITIIIMVKAGQNESSFEKLKRIIQKNHLSQSKKTNEQNGLLEKIYEQSRLTYLLLTEDTANASAGRIKAIKLAAEGKLQEAARSIDEKNELKKLQVAAFKTDSLLVSVKKDFLYKAKLAEANATFKEADALYRQLIDIDSADEKNLFEYAQFLQNQDRLSESENYYRKALAKYQILIKTKPSQEADFAALLHKMGNLMVAKNNFDEAEAYYMDALQIRQKLTDKNPELYTRDLAYTTNNLGNLYRTKSEISQALYYYNQAFSLFKILEEKNPSEYAYPVSTALLNLGIIAEDMQDWVEAEKHYKDAEYIVKTYTNTEPLLFKSQHAKILNNLGNLYLNSHNDYPRALECLKASLKLRQELAQINPALFENAIAQSLTNIAIVYNTSNNFVEAQKYYEDALKRFRTLVAKEPDTYEPYIARVLNNTAILYKNIQQFAKAKAYSYESLALYRKLASRHPAVYEIDAARVIMNIGVLFKTMADLGLSYGDRDYIIALMREGWQRIQNVSLENPDRSKFKTSIESLYKFFNKQSLF